MLFRGRNRRQIYRVVQNHNLSSHFAIMRNRNMNILQLSY